MNRISKTAVAVTATAVAALGMTACTETDDCDSSAVLVYVNGQYHYGSPSGKLVPDSKVPSSARKVPGYKPYTPPKAPAVKAPAPAVKVPLNKPAAPRSGRR